MALTTAEFRDRFPEFNTGHKQGVEDSIVNQQRQLAEELGYNSDAEGYLIIAHLIETRDIDPGAITATRVGGGNFQRELGIRSADNAFWMASQYGSRVLALRRKHRGLSIVTSG